MNPPGEQLIRDYLNRLSVAAESSLEPGDRQALLDQTRAQIEAEAGDLGRATAVQVRRVLAAIGDPIAVAENERARLAAPRDPAAGSRATGAVRKIWPPPGVLAIGGRSARRPASRQPATPAAMRPLPPGTANLGVPPPREPARHEGQSEPEKDGQQATPGQDGTDHGQPDDEDVPGAELNIELLEPVVYEEVGPSWLSRRASAAAGWLSRRASAAAGWLSRRASAAAGWLSQFGSALVATALRGPLETIAVLVLGIGGGIYPPIWLIGAFIVVISRNWDLRDKWFALTIPFVIVIFGATLAIVLGGQHTSLGSYAFEAWLAAGRLSRIAAVLSAMYLLWRLYKGPREPRRPPWTVPRRPG
jgi:hypothetical protein